ncbi:MAG: hypothetical protein WC807_08590 [Hyphomicrobium sp.]|jgi:hypothetical protein
MAMTDTNVELTADAEMDDLPRTFRREREARAREAREREAREREARERPVDARREREPGFSGAPAYLARGRSRVPHVYGDDPISAAVTHFDVPFFRLMGFFLKAVFAAVPALIVLGVMMWFAGKGLSAYYPELVRMKIMITFPNG